MVMKSIPCCFAGCFDLFQRLDRECLNSAGGLWALLILF